jgi:Ser/Thr protein kinase RdoA (MazF antagonist)
MPVIPPLVLNAKTLHETDGIYFAVFPKKGGQTLNEFDQALWEQLGRLLARTHNIGKTIESPNRIRWEPQTATVHHLSALQDAKVIPPDFQTAWDRVSKRFCETSFPLFKNIDMTSIHGDCHRGNLIYRPGEGIFLVDFDDMAVGPAIQDLWMLLPGEPAHCRQELDWFIAGYDLFRPFPYEQLKLIPALRGMRLIHFAAWCASQGGEAHFKHHFPEWGTARYWNELIRDLQELNN